VSRPRTKENIINRRHLDFLLVGLLLLVGAAGNAAEDPAAAAAAAMEAAGVPMYPGAVYVVGDVETGMRIAAGDDPQTVRTWYRENLPEWSVYHNEEIGIWTLYDGPEGLTGYGDIMVLNNISIGENENLPAWHALKDNMTTEITMALPRVGPAKAGGPMLLIPGSDGRSDAAEEVEGALYQAEDMQTDRGGYYYLQDEQYMEHTVAFETDLPTEIVRKLDSISQTYEKVRIVGVVLTNENEGTSRFDRTWDIEIFVEE